MNSGTGNDLRSIHGSSANSIVAVGESGTILRFNGTSWNPMPALPVNADVHSVHVASPSSIWVVASADKTRIYHFNGSLWTEAYDPNVGVSSGIRRMQL